MIKRSNYWLILLSVACIWACDDDETNTPSQAGEVAGESAGSEAGESAGTEVAGEENEVVMGMAKMAVTDYASGATVAEASVCNTATDVCATTNADGIADFQYIVGESALITVDAAQYFGAQVNIQLSPNEDETPNDLSIAIVGRAAAELVVATAPEEIELGNDQVGHIIAWSSTPSGTNLAGAAFAIDPASGKGPFYFADGNIIANVSSGAAYAPDASSTSGNGFVQFLEVEPGEYSMTITHEDRTCTASYGLPNSDNQATFTVSADRLSYVFFSCDGPEPYLTDVTLSDYATGSPIEGATVCNVQMDMCSDTDATGNTSVPYIRDADNTFTFTKDDYFPANVAYTAGANLNSDFVDGVNSIATTMIMRSQVEIIVSQAPTMPTIDPTKSGIVATAFDRNGEGVEGVSVSLSPASGDGPFYFAEGSLLANASSGEAFDADASATTSNGVLTYINVDPGSYTLSFNHETLTCVAGAGLAAEGNAIRLETVADALTYFSVYCYDLTGMQPSNIQIVDGSNGSPVSGATICPMADVADAECYTTDETGVATIMYEPGVNHVATTSAETYMTARVSYTAVPPADGSIPNLRQQILKSAIVETIVTQAEGVEAVDETKGHVAMLAVDGAGGTVADVSFAIEPISGVGPQYFAEGDLLINSATGMAYDSDASATTSNGFANLINADPGAYTLTASHPTATCVATQGIQNADGTVGFDVASEQLTFVTLICTE